MDLFTSYPYLLIGSETLECAIFNLFVTYLKPAGELLPAGYNRFTSYNMIAS